MVLAGNILIAAGLLLCIAGALCIVFAKNFRQRLLLGSLIDSCGLLTFAVGFMLRAGFSFFTFKALLILGIVLLVNPITANKIAYGAFYGHTGGPAAEEREDDDAV